MKRLLIANLLFFAMPAWAQYYTGFLDLSGVRNEKYSGATYDLVFEVTAHGHPVAATVEARRGHNDGYLKCETAVSFKLGELMLHASNLQQRFSKTVHYPVTLSLYGRNESSNQEAPPCPTAEDVLKKSQTAHVKFSVGAPFELPAGEYDKVNLWLTPHGSGQIPLPQITARNGEFYLNPSDVIDAHFAKELAPVSYHLDGKYGVTTDSLANDITYLEKLSLLKHLK